jgi:hypothetical protein
MHIYFVIYIYICIDYIYVVKINCGQDENCEEAKKDLRSRGLCLVPVSCTLDVGVDVVAGPGDYWAAAAPAFGMGFGG